MSSLNIDECFPCYADDIQRYAASQQRRTVSDDDDENKQAEGEKRPKEKMGYQPKPQTQL